MTASTSSSPPLRHEDIAIADLAADLSDVQAERDRWIAALHRQIFDRLADERRAAGWTT